MDRLMEFENPYLLALLLPVAAVSIIVLTALALYSRADLSVSGFWRSLVLAVALFLYPWHGFRLGEWTGRAGGIFLMLWAGVVVSFAIVFAVYAVANYPKEGTFDAQIEFSFGPRSEQEAWERFVVLSTDTEPDRDDILEFLAQNVVSAPQDFSAFTKDPLFTSVRASEELKEIGQLTETGSHSRANEKYLRLWKVADNLISGKGELLQHLVARGIVEQLIDFYLDGDARASLPAGKLILELASEFQRKVDDSWENAALVEYIQSRRSLDTLDDCSILPLDEKLPLCWPFLDFNKTMRIDHDTHFFSWGLLSRVQYPDVESDPEAFVKYVGRNAGGGGLVNPTGSAFLAVPFTYPGRPDRPSVFDGQLVIFIWVVESTASGIFGDVPIDPRTGEPFILNDKGQSIEIMSADTNKDGEPLIRYEITK